MPGLRHVEEVMGTAVSFDVRDDISTEALLEAVRWLHHVDETFSTYRSDSAISRLGRGEVSVADLDDELGVEVAAVLELCEQLRIDTDGTFDISAVPAPNGTHLDPSGLVKGWAIEHAAHLLTSSGALNLSINAGGDVALRGEAGSGQPWRVGIRHPGEASLVAAVVTGSGPLAVATSATYERGAHIIDPRTGEPTTELASVTIVGPDLTYADAYATAVFVMGLDGLHWLAKHPAYDGFAITHDEMTYATDGFARYR